MSTVTPEANLAVNGGPKTVEEFEDPPELSTKNLLQIWVTGIGVDLAIRA